MTTITANRGLQLFGWRIRPEGVVALVGLAVVWQIVSYFTPPFLFPSVPQIVARNDLRHRRKQERRRGRGDDLPHDREADERDHAFRPDSPPEQLQAAVGCDRGHAKPLVRAGQ